MNNLFKNKRGPVSQLMLALLVGGVIGSFCHSTALAYLVTAAMVSLAFIKYEAPKGAFFNSLDISKLTDSLGEYCRENRDIIVTETLLDTNFDEKYIVLDDVTDEIPLPSLQVGDIVKPGDPVNFNPTENAIGLGNRTLKVYPCKVDLLLIPQVLEKTWLGKMKKPSDFQTLPFEAFLMDTIIKKAKENIRLNAIYKGVYNAAGTTAKDTMQGFEKLLSLALAASEIEGVVTGAITQTNILDKLLLTYDSGLNDAYKGVVTVCDLATQHFDWVARKFQPVINTSLVVTDGAAALKMPMLTEMPLPGTNAILRREPGKSATEPWVFTPKENMYMGVDSSVFNIDIQKFNRSLKILIDFKYGVQYSELFDGSVGFNVAA